MPPGPKFCTCNFSFASQTYDILLISHNLIKHLFPAAKTYHTDRRIEHVLQTVRAAVVSPTNSFHRCILMDGTCCQLCFFQSERMIKKCEIFVKLYDWINLALFYVHRAFFQVVGRHVKINVGRHMWTQQSACCECLIEHQQHTEDGK